MNRSALPLSFLLLLLLDFSLLAQTPTWPQFRGVGSTVNLEDQTLPDEFGPQKNVLWRTETPAGSSSPCIWGDRLFLTGFDDDRLQVHCYSRKSGELMWQVDFERPSGESYAHPASSPAASTSCTDGERLFAYFGIYGLIALDMDGNELWKKTFDFQTTQFGHGASPILHDGFVYLVRDLDQGSALYCLDAATGEERWVTPRPEARGNYSTPVVWRDQLIVVGTSVLKAYDLQNGEPQWWVGGLTIMVCPSPVTSEDTLYFGGWCTANVEPVERLASGFDDESGLTDEDFQSVENLFAKLDADNDGKLSLDELPPGRARDTFATMDFNKNDAWETFEIQGLMSFPTMPGKNILVAIRPGGEGDVTESHVLWEKNRGIPYVATPLLYKDRLYYFKKGGLVSCLNATTGEPYYETQRLDMAGEYYSTPIGVGDRVFVGAQRGTMLVLGTGDELEVIARNDFGEEIVASPAVIDNTMYLRTAGNLYAIGRNADD